MKCSTWPLPWQMQETTHQEHMTYLQCYKYFGVMYQKSARHKINNVIINIYISLRLPKHHAIVSHQERTQGASLTTTDCH